MNFEEMKRWLNRAWKEEVYIRLLHRELKKVEDDATSIQGVNYEKDRVQTTRLRESNFERDVMKIYQLKDQIRMMIKEQSQIKSEILEMVNKLDDNVYKSLIIARHINFLEWIEITLEVNYSKSRCHYLYNQAVNELCLMMNEEGK